VACLDALDRNRTGTDEEFDRVYQRIQLEEQENRLVLSLRILGNSLPILRKRRHSCMTVKSAVNSFSAIAH
ncbi:hypothetical protein L9F63_022659, partial [Diploptera punctata]